MVIQLAKETPEAERDALKTLLALDVPFERAVSLVTDETSRAIRGTLAQYAWLIRDSRMPQLPEGSEARRRLGMVADMLDPSAEDTWDYTVTP
jgi:hypothetical protein